MKDRDPIELIYLLAVLATFLIINFWRRKKKE